jgi:hypothetical protein
MADAGPISESCAPAIVAYSDMCQSTGGEGQSPLVDQPEQFGDVIATNASNPYP